VLDVEYAGAAASRPAPGVLEAIREADLVVVCPSNPVTSVGPVLAVPGMAQALAAVRSRVVAVSPIVGGAAVSGPAGELMRARGLPVSPVGVAAAFGAEPLASLGPVENSSHTSAVAFAQAEAARRGARVFLTVPGDVPCVTADEIRALAAAVADGAPAFAPSRSGFGTNGVALT